MDDDKIDMEDIEHQGENEDVKTIENNFSKKKEEERIQKMLMEAMVTHELLVKNFFEIYLTKNGNFVFMNTLVYGSNCGG